MRRRKRRNGRSGALAILVFMVAIGSVLFAGYKLYEPPFEPPMPATAPVHRPAQIETPGSSVETEDVLILVNKDNPIPDGYAANLVAFENVYVAKVLLDDLMAMRRAAAEENVVLVIRSAYRTSEEQETVFDEAVAGYVSQGNSQNAAEEKAERVAARPGHSEHQTGLAIDFSLAADAERQTEMWDWLSRNAQCYGFILRYPEGKEHVTGYGFEPWHYRYVGRGHAISIVGQGLLLEEYLIQSSLSSLQSADQSS